MGSGLDHCQWAGDNRLSVGRPPGMEFGKKTTHIQDLFSTFNPTHLRRLPTLGLREHSGSMGWEWGLPQECFPLPDEAEPGTALLALLIKCQAQLSWLNVFHPRKNVNQVSWDPYRSLKARDLFSKGEATRQTLCWKAHLNSHRSANIFS